MTIPLNPKPLTIVYVGVTASGFSKKDISYLNNPYGAEDSDSEDFNYAPKTKKQLPGHFALAENNAGSKLTASSIDLDPTRFRMFRLSFCPPMSDYFIPIPIEHFFCGLRLLLDPAFCDFLNSIRSQPAHINPNGV